MKSLSLLKIIILIIIPVLFVIIPTSFIENRISLCPVKIIFGINCPGCGTSRAISSVFHFQFVKAINYNRSIVAVFPLLCYVWLKFIINEIESIFPCNTSVKKLKSLFKLK